MKYRYPILLFCLLLGTCGRAQLTTAPTALYWLSDQLPEVGLAFGAPGGDYGPTRLVFAEEILRWRPAKVAAAWTGYGIDQPGLGAFTPHKNQYSYRNRYRFSFGGAPEQQAALFNYRPRQGAWRGLHLQYYRDARQKDTDEDGLNDFPQRERFLAESSFQFPIGEKFSSSLGGHFLAANLNQDLFTDPELRTGSTIDKRLQVQYRASLNLEEFTPFLNADFRWEDSNRDYASNRRSTDASFFTLRTGVNYRAQEKEIRAALYADFRQQRDELAYPDLSILRQEELFTLSSHFQYPLAPFLLEFNQQYQSSNLVANRYLPNVKLSVFPFGEDFWFSGLLNRGGVYRNPLISEAYLAFTERTYQLENLLPEDFWRSGFDLGGQSRDGRLQYTLQALQYRYQRFTAVSFARQDNLLIEQRENVRRRNLRAEVSGIIHIGYNYDHRLHITANYRFSELKVPDNYGLLLPARHAYWLRLRHELVLGQENDWSITTSCGYQWQEGLAAIGEEDSSLPQRDRLDASLRVKFKDYWIGFSGEQLLRKEPLFAYGFDPNTAGSSLPLGSPYATLMGRTFTLALGASLE
ncbi:MAG: hypothetical protein AAGF89_04965 [Bacteroidota bacterium]